MHTRHYPSAVHGSAVTQKAIPECPHSYAPEGDFVCEISAAEWRNATNGEHAHNLVFDGTGFTEGTFTFTFSGPDIATTEVEVIAETDEDATRDNAVTAFGLLDFVSSAVAAISAGELDVNYVAGKLIDLSVAFVADVQTFEATFDEATGGDGNYDFIFGHASINDLPAAARTTRVIQAGGALTDTQLADAMEVEIEAHAALTTLVASADNTLGVNAIVGFSGVSGLTVTYEGPEDGVVIEETTGETLVAIFAYGILDLDTFRPKDVLHDNIVRTYCYLETAAELLNLEAALHIGGAAIVDLIDVSAVGVYPMTSTIQGTHPVGRPRVTFATAVGESFPTTGSLFVVIKYIPKVTVA